MRLCEICFSDISGKRAHAKVCGTKCYSKLYWRDNKNTIDRSDYHNKYRKENAAMLREASAARYACEKDQYREKRAAYYAANSEKIKQRSMAHYWNNRESVALYARGHVSKNINRHMLKSAKNRAEKQGVPFDLTASDIVIPSFCPVLGIALKRGVGGWCDGSPSLDRFIPELGYVKDNVCVISHRANMIKTNATVDEVEAVAFWMRCKIGVAT